MQIRVCSGRVCQFHFIGFECFSQTFRSLSFDLVVRQIQNGERLKGVIQMLATHRSRTCIQLDWSSAHRPSFLLLQHLSRLTLVSKQTVSKQSGRDYDLLSHESFHRTWLVLSASAKHLAPWSRIRSLPRFNVVSV